MKSITMREKTSKSDFSIFDHYPFNCKDTLEKASGSSDSDVQIALVKQVLDPILVLNGLPPEELAIKYQAAVGMLMGINPQDELEGMIAAQMVAVHNMSMECIRRAMIPKQTFEGVDQSLKHAEKLVALHAKLVDTLNKHRGKGQQKVTVEYVNVEKGGQAVVGTINTGKPTNILNPKESPQSPVTAVISNDPDKPIDFETPQIAAESDEKSK